MKRVNILAILTALSLLLLFFPLMLYFSQFNNGFSTHDTSWANFGSYFGGIVASIFSFASFITVLFSLIRSEDLREQDTEEKHLFHLFDIFEKNRNTLYCYIDDTKQYFGPEVIEQYKNLFFNIASTDRDQMGLIAYFVFLESSARSYINLAIHILKRIETSKSYIDYINIFSLLLTETEKQLLVLEHSDFFSSRNNMRSVLFSDTTFSSMNDIREKVNIAKDKWKKTNT